VGATSCASVVAELVGCAPVAGPRRRVVLLGAGRFARSLAGALAAVPAAELTIVNRTLGTARELAERHGASAAGFDRLEAELADADALVCATDAPHPLVSAATISRAAEGRQRPLMIVDLAVPRDVEPSAAAVSGVRVHDIDAVQHMVSRNLAMRRREAQVAGAIVRRETTRFAAWRRELVAAPVVGSVWRQAEQLRREELARVADALSAEERDRLERLSTSLVSKLLHGPCERLRAACGQPDGAAHIESFRMLFDVAGETDGDLADVIAIAQQGAA
jgi:glutamyl-tRNA reductase